MRSHGLHQRNLFVNAKNYQHWFNITLTNSSLLVSGYILQNITIKFTCASWNDNKVARLFMLKNMIDVLEFLLPILACIALRTRTCT